MTCAWIVGGPLEDVEDARVARMRLILYSSAKPLPPWICSALSRAGPGHARASQLGHPASRGRSGGRCPFFHAEK